MSPVSPSVARAISKLGGNIVDPRGYERMEEDWQIFLNNSGVQYFTAGEFCAHIAAAGFHRERAVPPHELFPASALVLLMADQLRRRLGSPIKGAWLYRDPEVNAARKGAKGSDHTKGAAVDLWFGNGDSTRGKKQLTRVLPLVWSLFGEIESPTFEPSIGEGKSKLHLGLSARLGERFWRY